MAVPGAQLDTFKPKKSTENHWVFFLLEYLWLYFYLLYHGSLVEDGKGCSSVGVGPGGL